MRERERVANGESRKRRELKQFRYVSSFVRDSVRDCGFWSLREMVNSVVGLSINFLLEGFCAETFCAHVF
jgi:hypothetical protein